MIQDTSVILSVIVAHYNHLQYIEECIFSVLNSKTSYSFEIIIIDDDSTATNAMSFLKAFEKESRIRVYHQQNAGQGAARNHGIKKSSGKYILSLDSDNYIAENFIQKAIDLLEKDQGIDIVYTDAFYVGENSGIMKQGPYNLQRIMLYNYIDNCMIYRKSLIDAVGGYDEKSLLRGMEDWDLNLRLGFHNYMFFYLEEPLFYYRILKSSSSSIFNRDKSKINRVIEYYHQKYPYHYSKDAIDNVLVGKIKRNPVSFILRMLLQTFFPAWIIKKYRENKIRKNIV